MSDWMAASYRRWLVRDLVIGMLLYLVGAAWIVMMAMFVWPLMSYSWHYWFG